MVRHMRHLTFILDSVATDLQSRGLVKLAAEVDMVANTLERAGTTSSTATQDMLGYLDMILRHYGNANDPVANMARLSAVRLRKDGNTQETLVSLEKLGALLGTDHRLPRELDPVAFGGFLENLKKMGPQAVPSAPPSEVPPTKEKVEDALWQRVKTLSDTGYLDTPVDGLKEVYGSYMVPHGNASLEMQRLADSLSLAKRYFGATDVASLVPGGTSWTGMPTEERYKKVPEVVRADWHALSDSVKRIHHAVVNDQELPAGAWDSARKSLISALEALTDVQNRKLFMGLAGWSTSHDEGLKKSLAIAKRL